VDIKKIADEYEKMNPNDYGSSLLRRTVDLLVLITELTSSEQELRDSTYGGSGTGRSWPGPNDGQGQKQSSRKQYREEEGIYIKKERYFGISKQVDYKRRNAVEDVNGAISKVEDAIGLLARTLRKPKQQEQQK